MIFSLVLGRLKGLFLTQSQALRRYSIYGFALAAGLAAVVRAQMLAQREAAGLPVVEGRAAWSLFQLNPLVRLCMWLLEPERLVALAGAE